MLQTRDYVDIGLHGRMAMLMSLMEIVMSTELFRFHVASKIEDLANIGIGGSPGVAGLGGGVGLLSPTSLAAPSQPVAPDPQHVASAPAGLSQPSSRPPRPLGQLPLAGLGAVGSQGEPQRAPSDPVCMASALPSPADLLRPVSCSDLGPDSIRQRGVLAGEGGRRGDDSSSLKVQPSRSKPLKCKSLNSIASGEDEGEAGGGGVTSPLCVPAALAAKLEPLKEEPQSHTAGPMASGAAGEAIEAQGGEKIEAATAAPHLPPLTDAALDGEKPFVKANTRPKDPDSMPSALDEKKVTGTVLDNEEELQWDGNVAEHIDAWRRWMDLNRWELSSCPFLSAPRPLILDMVKPLELLKKI